MEALLASVRDATGLDFRGYARSTVRRRIGHVALRRGIDVGTLALLVRSGGEVLREVIDAVCVVVTSMFRDPEFFARYRACALPLLRGAGPVRAWHAGCATGEEVWSHAVLLREEALARDARLYGTDVCAWPLARAQRGLLSLDRMREYTAAYLRAGGQAEFSRYYSATADEVTVAGELRRGVVFGRHDLTAEAPLGTFDVVFCRNVLIYFDPPLQERVMEVLTASVREGGILALGRGEALGERVRRRYVELDARNRIFRRV